ncbi:MAG: Dynamin- GTPase protein [Cyphobasidiales sp. Tagirdzhanova-0007]|nr:MAG: Dynamin- GTPase protein [Cyphobasidiales sp. Tagirdzhanova-0007]
MALNSDLIHTMNKMQEVFAEAGESNIDLPQIVVVGSQSSGKSSVLETIVSRDFLPRGSGIVTRRPLVLQLVHIPSDRDRVPAPKTTRPSEHARESSEDSTSTSAATPSKTPPKQEWGEFLHTQSKRYYDFNDIRKEIEAETLRIAGSAKGISRQPIHLKIYSTEVLNLTLVDLPGLTKVPVGDQPTNIEIQIERLVRDYIEKPNCIILAISPANVDLANSDSLRLARKIDPQGRRTIGVLTKLDLMDAGTNALDILNGRVYPLKLGFIGVVNRSQQDIITGKPMDQALDDEMEFFKSHPGYRNMAHRLGTKYLARTLNQVLMNHIRDKLPDMKARLNTLMGQTQQELNAFGGGQFMGEQHRGSLILSLMTQFVRDFVSSIDGTSPEASTKELCGGARIYYIFNDVFGHALESIEPTSNLTTSDIRTAIRNSKGPRPSLFLPEVAFELLVKPQIRLLEPPSLRCVELVYEELMKICHNCTSKELQRYPRLHARLVEVVSELLRERLGPTTEYVQSLIAIQTAYINTNHPSFRAGTQDYARQKAAQAQNPRPKGMLEGRRMPDGLIEEVPETGSSSQDEEGEGGYPVLGNGIPPARGAAPSSSNPAVDREINKIRSASSSQHDRKPSMSSSSGSHQVNSALYGSQQQPQNSSRSVSNNHLHVPYHSSSASMSQPKDSFLNYFFGGASVAGGSLVADSATSASSRHARASLPELGGLGRDNPLLGRKGHEGAAAAYDMKSLERHLDADQLPTAAPAANGSVPDQDEMAIDLIQSLISTYFSIVRQTIQDLVPKAVMHLLIGHSRESVQNRLVASLYKENLFEELLFEDEGLTAERKRIKALLDSYKEGFRVLSEVL